MSLPRPPQPDSLRPTEQAALDAWAARVRADHEQVERCREIEDAPDFYEPFARRFALDPRRTDEAALDVLCSMVRADEVWLDIGAGGGRYALPIALRARSVIAVDPSPSMLDVLRAGMRVHGVRNVEVREGRWPPAEAGSFAADVALMAHVGYDIEAIGEFLDAAEAAASRACVAVFSEGATTTAAALLWRPVHGEDRLPLPALPELLTLLVARGRLPTVVLTPRQPPTFGSIDELLTMARRQLWVRPGSAKDARLRSIVEATATQRDAGWALDWRVTRVGIVSCDVQGD